MKNQQKQSPTKSKNYSKNQNQSPQNKKLLPLSHNMNLQTSTYQFNIQTKPYNSLHLLPPYQNRQQLPSKIHHTHIDPSVALSYKQIKNQYILTQKFKKYNSILLQSQLEWLSNLQHMKAQLNQALFYLKQKQLISSFQCQQIFNQDHWFILIEASKDFGKKLSQLVTNDKLSWKKIGDSVFRTLNKLSEQFQFYKQEYIKISKILTIINILQIRIAKQLLQSNQLQQKQSNFSKNNNEQQSQRQLVKKITSQILQQDQIQTKYTFPQHQPTHPSNNNSTQIQTKQQKYEKLLKINSIIRKHIFKPLIKLSQFIQKITTYINLFMKIWQNNQKNLKQQLQNTIQLIQIFKSSIRKLSIVLMKIMWNSFSQNQNTQNQKQVANWICLKYPQLYYQTDQLDNLSKNYAKNKSKQLNIDQIKEDEAPFILSFNTFSVTFMDIPCQLYLITNYLIIIQSTNQNQKIIQTSNSMAKSKLKKIKDKIINKLAIVHIDHTTRIEIVGNQMLYANGFVVYISGGFNSNGVFLKFRGKSIEENAFAQHKNNCKQRKTLFNKSQSFSLNQCQVCSGQLIKQWQNNNALSNLNIFKTILDLTISYHTFLYNTFRYPILEIRIPQKYSLSCNYPQSTLSSNSKSKHRKTTIKPKNTSSQFSFYKYNFQQQIIPKDRVLSINVLGIQNFIMDQIYQKYYVIQFMVWVYRAQGMLNNCHAVSEIVYLSQKQIYQIQQYIFKILPTIKNPTSPSSLFPTYHSIYRLAQSYQVYVNAHTQAQKQMQIECMIITQFFNTIFKRQQFRKKPQVICTRLKLPQGLWVMLTNGVEMNKIEIFQYAIGQKQIQKDSLKSKKIYVRKINNKCYCQQCTLQNQDTFTYLTNDKNHKKQPMNKFWKYYNQGLSFPYDQCYKIQDNNDSHFKLPENQQKKQLHKKIKNQSNSTQIAKIMYHKIQKFIKILMKIQLQIKRRKRPYCPLFARRLQLNNIQHLSKQFSQETNNKMLSSKKQSISQIILYHFNKIRYISYLSTNYRIQSSIQQKNKQTSIDNNKLSYSLLNYIIKTHKVRSLNVILYSFPSISDYYYQLKQQKPQNFSQYYKQLLLQNYQCSIPQNQGYTCKLFVNIRQDTTCKHLKYIIGQRLGINEEYIMSFMDSFTLVIVEKVEKSNNKSFLFSKLFTKKVKTQYVIKQINILSDHQKVYDILDLLRQSENQNYFISIKKLYKPQQPYPHQLTQLNPQNNSKLLQNYYKILQFQLAQICYKLNNKLILINTQSNTFLLKYIILLFAFLHNKIVAKNQKFKQKYKIQLNQKLLIKTGLISKTLLQQYFSFNLQQQQQILSNKNYSKQQKQKLITQNNIIRQQRRQQLTKLCFAQIQMKQNQYLIMNKIFTLVYEQTDWDVWVQQVLCIKNQESIVGCFLFISREGILLRSKQSKQNSRGFNRDSNVTFKSVLKTSKKTSSSEQLFLQYSYDSLELQTYGSIITLIIPKNSKQFIEYQKYNLFTTHPYFIYQLIKFYKLNKKITPIQLFLTNVSKLKQKFEEQKSNSRKYVDKQFRNLECNSNNYMKINIQRQRKSNQNGNLYKKSGIFALEEQFKSRNQKSMSSSSSVNFTNRKTTENQNI